MRSPLQKLDLDHAVAMPQYLQLQKTSKYDLLSIV